MASMKEVRKEKELTQIELARRAHVGLQTVWRMEKGKPMLRAQAEHIASALGVQLDHLEDVVLVHRIR